MSRFSVATVGVVLLSGVASGQAPGEVLSYNVILPPNYENLGIPVPEGGFVLTDLVGVWGTQEIAVEVDQDAEAKLRWHSTTGALNLSSGIPFASGTTMNVRQGSPSPFTMTMSGYVPMPAGAVPAVGELGMAVMIALVLVVGCLVFVRMKQRQAA